MHYTLVRAGQKYGTISALHTNLCKPFYFVTRTRFGGNDGADLGRNYLQPGKNGSSHPAKLRRQFPSSSLKT